jgi:hypothetical protein
MANSVSLTGVTNQVTVVYPTYTVTPVILNNTITVDNPYVIVQVPSITNVIQLDNKTPVITVNTPNVTVSLVDSPVVVNVQLASANVITACQQGPEGPAGPIGPPGVADPQVDTVVTSGSTEKINEVLLATKRSVKWFVTVTDSANGIFACSEVAGIHNGTTAFWTHYAKIGGPLNYNVAVVVNGPQLELEATNNESGSVEFSVVRVVTDVV